MALLASKPGLIQWPPLGATAMPGVPIDRRLRTLLTFDNPGPDTSVRDLGWESTDWTIGGSPEKDSNLQYGQHTKFIENAYYHDAGLAALPNSDVLTALAVFRLPSSANEFDRVYEVGGIDADGGFGLEKADSSSTFSLVTWTSLNHNHFFTVNDETDWHAILAYATATYIRVWVDGSLVVDTATNKATVSGPTTISGRAGTPINNDSITDFSLFALWHDWHVADAMGRALSRNPFGFLRTRLNARSIRAVTGSQLLAGLTGGDLDKPNRLYTEADPLQIITTEDGTELLIESAASTTTVVMLL